MALEVGDPVGPPAFGGPNHGAEHELADRLLAEGALGMSMHSRERRQSNMDEETYCHGKVIRLRTEAFQDERGVLSPIQFVPYNFQPVRAFVITASPGAIRGGHGHARGRQLFMLVSGEIEVEVVYRNCGARLRLDPEHRAVLIEPFVWSRQLYCGHNPAMVVFCDTPYDPRDYIWSDARPEGVDIPSGSDVH